jgi:hypothetical protein
LKTSPGILRTLAALVWYIGAAVLILKGSSLLAEAHDLQPGRFWPAIAVAAGLLIGGLKGILLFTKSCHKNLDRIAGLAEPKLWQFFRPGFFLALALMISAGATLSRLAHGHFKGLIAVAILDLSIGTALLLSSYVFWKRKTLARRTPS